MARSIPQRRPRENEVLALAGSDGKSCIAVVKRPDGLFWCFEDLLCYDEDEAVYYWSEVSNPISGVYASVEEAEQDIRRRGAGG